MKDSNNSTIFVAENNNNELVGYLFAIGGDAKRNKHSAYIVVGISENYRGQGVGSKLFKELEQWATQHGIHRLELTVVTRNQAGLSLYKKWASRSREQKDILYSSMMSLLMNTTCQS